MNENIMIPRSLFERIVELLDGFDASRYGYNFCREYEDVQAALEVKMQKLELRNAYARIASAEDEDARVMARIQYQRLWSRMREKDVRTKNDRLVLLRDSLMEYEATIGGMTVQELVKLRQWVADGNSPYDNPCFLYGDNGVIMDYITAIRINEDMCLNPDDYFPSPGQELCPDDEDDDLPF